MMLTDRQTNEQRWKQNLHISAEDLIVTFNARTVHNKTPNIQSYRRRWYPAITVKTQYNFNILIFELQSWNHSGKDNDIVVLCTLPLKYQNLVGRYISFGNIKMLNNDNTFIQNTVYWCENLKASQNYCLDEKHPFMSGSICLQYMYHDDVIKWKYFPRYWSFVRGIHRSPVNSPHKGQWRGALIFSLMCTRINSCVNNREAGDLRRYRHHYDVIVMIGSCTEEV